MKKFFIILSILLLVGLVLLGLFLAAFDADRYRPMVVKQMQTALGRPVHLERISLNWRSGIALELKNFSVEPDGSAKEPAQVEKIEVMVKLLPLLKKQIQMASLSVIRPRLHLDRGPDGALKVDGLFPLPQQAAAPAAAGKTSPSAALPLLVSRVRVEGGTLHLTDSSMKPALDLTLTDLQMDLQNISLIPPGSVQLKRFFAKVGAGTIEASGSIDGFLATPAAQLKISVDGVRLESLFQGVAPGQPSLRGQLTGSFDAAFRGTGPEMIQSLSGQGRLNLKEGALVNMNLLREIFQKISIIPGLADTLSNRLPESYKEKFAVKDTLFEPMDLSMTLGNGALSFNDLKVGTDAFELGGTGRVGLDGAVTIQSRVRIDPTLSAAIVRSVEELQFLSDGQGQLEIPVVIQGTLPQISILPDVGYVASHLVSKKTEELIGGLLQKWVDKQEKKEKENGEPGS